MKNIFNSIIGNIINPILSVGRQTSLKLLKIEVARRRIKIVKKVHLIFLSGTGLLFLYSVFTCGFAMLIATGFIVVMMKLGIKIAVVCLFLGGATFCFVPLAIFSIFCSEKKWLKYTDCDPMLDDVFSEK